MGIAGMRGAFGRRMAIARGAACAGGVMVTGAAGTRGPESGVVGLEVADHARHGVALDELLLAACGLT
jgi:hypothetical protein